MLKGYLALAELFFYEIQLCLEAFAMAELFFITFYAKLKLSAYIFHRKAMGPWSLNHIWLYRARVPESKFIQRTRSYSK